MKKFFYCLVIAIAALLPAPSVLAADMDVPPPMGDLRPATYDWSGPYIGAFVGGITETGDYFANCGACSAPDGEMNGFGWNGGLLAGWSYQIDNFVLGVEGDWAFGGEVAENNEPSQLNHLDFDNVATLRARTGLSFDNTLIYITGGAAFVDTTFSTDDLGGASASDSAWLTGWVIGGGMEHAFTDRLSGRIEYMYIDLPDHTYELSNSVPLAVDVDQNYSGIHTIRAGLAYNFGW
ncbi:MAG: outer membrane protein [Aestuariivirga sp.]